MKVVHLSIYDRRGGACIAAYRQHQALLRAGVDSTMLVRFGISGEPEIDIFSPNSSPLARLYRKARRAQLSLDFKSSSPVAEFFDERGDLSGEIKDVLPDADVFNLQFSQGFLDHSAFFRAVPASTPIVLTLHEMSWFTGGCAYSGSCRRFEAKCGSCPLLRRPAIKDFSSRGWERRLNLFRSRNNLHFVADSHWILEQARASSLLRGCQVSLIHYGIDTAVFRPLQKDPIRLALGLPNDTPVVAFAASSVADPRKGMKELLRAIRVMNCKPILLTWGRNIPEVDDELAHLHLGNLDSDLLMALAYNAADVFVMPSLEEAFGQTALESVACGVPVVAFNAGGISDTIVPGLNGYLVPVGDIQGLASAIDEAVSDRELGVQWRSRATDWTDTYFSYAKNAQNYMRLYSQMLTK